MSYSGASGATTNAQQQQQSQNNAQPSNTDNNNPAVNNPENNSQNNNDASNIPQSGTTTTTNSSSLPINSSPINPNPINNQIQQQHNPNLQGTHPPPQGLPSTCADSIPYTASAAAAAGSYPHIVQNSDIPNSLQNPPQVSDPYNQNNLTMLQANSQLSSPSTAAANAAAPQNGVNGVNNPNLPNYPTYATNGATTPTGASTSTEWTSAGAAAAAAATANPYAMPGYTTAAAMAGAYGPMGAPGAGIGYADPSAAYGYGGYGYDMSDGVRRKNATIRESTNTLKAWLNEHKKNPYPTKGEKIMLAIITKMTLTQVSTWFANARRRLKKENKMTWVPKNRSADDNSGKSDDEDNNGGNNAGNNTGLQMTTERECKN